MAVDLYPVPGRVIAVLTNSTILVVLCPGTGLVNGGIPREILLEQVPIDLRTPNTELIVILKNGEIVEIQPKPSDG